MSKGGFDRSFLQIYGSHCTESAESTMYIHTDFDLINDIFLLTEIISYFVKITSN